jgi:hypothetical protein
MAIGRGTQENEWSGKQPPGALGTGERAVMSGGEFVMRSAPGISTIVTVRIPARGSPDAEETAYAEDSHRR